MNQLKRRQTLLKAQVSENQKLAGMLWEQKPAPDQLQPSLKEALRRNQARNGQSGFDDRAPAGLGAESHLAQGEAPESQANRLESGRRRQQPAIIIVKAVAQEFMIIKRALWKAGATARVWWAHDSVEAMSILNDLEDHVSDICMVADVKTPETDGFDLLRKVKTRKGQARVRIAFLTTRTEKPCRSRANQDRADAYFVRPNTADEWLAVARALQRLARTGTAEPIRMA